MEKTQLFSTSFGIQGFVKPQTNSNIPTAKPLASTGSNEIATVEHFNNLDLKTISEKFLSPEIGDGECLRPDVFNKTLLNFANKFENSQDAEVKAFVDEIVKPVLENKELLQAYRNLMIGG